MGGDGDPRVPDWAQLMNAPQFARFVAILETALAAHPWSGDLRSGALEVERVDGARVQLGLTNLLQVCHAAPPDDWPAAVADHFEKLLGPRAAADHAIETALVADFGRARGALRVRLWPADYRDQVGAGNLVWREDLPGIVTGLVLDLPWSVRALQPAEVAAWGLPVADLFALGLQQVWRNCPPQLERVGHADLPEVLFLTSPAGDFFAASHALLLDRHAGALGRHGALVGVPHRHMVVVHAFEDLRVVGAVNRLLPFVRRCWEEGPGSIDPDLFWYRGGRFLRLPCELLDDGALRFAPPAEFEELVARLREER
jgi:hypothetical protein